MRALRRRAAGGWVVVALVAACGAPTKPTPDAGPVIDTSCGLDCAAQKSFGLLLNTCFEYAEGATGTSPPALGIYVREVFTLEGGVKTLVVEYSALGQKKMTDSFGIVDGRLLLMRREFAGGQSVTYKDSSNAIVGVGWLERGSAPGSNLASTASADVLLGGSNRKSESTQYRVTLSAPSSAVTAPYQTAPFDGGVRMDFSETPDHGSDGLRVWVPDLGIVLFSSSFQLASGGSSPQYRLQKVRMIDVADGGDKPCSTGTL